MKELKTCPVKTDGKRCNRYLRWGYHFLASIGLLLPGQDRVCQCPVHGFIQMEEA